MNPSLLRYKKVKTVAGPIQLGVTAQGVALLCFSRSPSRHRNISPASDHRITAAGQADRRRLETASRILQQAEKALHAYFKGSYSALDRCPVDAAGTVFQKKVWRAMRRIPAGDTVSYGALARQIGRSGAARAVGNACNQNPVCLMVPCHRIVGALGRLGGYAPGVRLKKVLLQHEGVRLTDVKNGRRTPSKPAKRN